MFKKISLCQVFGLSLTHNMHDVTQIDELYVIDNASVPDNAVEKTLRIEICKAQDQLWRVVMKDTKVAFAN